MKVRVVSGILFATAITVLTCASILFSFHVFTPVFFLGNDDVDEPELVPDEAKTETPEDAPKEDIDDKNVDSADKSQDKIMTLATIPKLYKNVSTSTPIHPKLRAAVTKRSVSKKGKPIKEVTKEDLSKALVLANSNLKTESSDKNVSQSLTTESDFIYPQDADDNNDLYKFKISDITVDNVKKALKGFDISEAEFENLKIDSSPLFRSDGTAPATLKEAVINFLVFRALTANNPESLTKQYGTTTAVKA